MLLPLFLSLEDRAVLVVGAGAVAERKVADLVAARARVRVVAPRASEGIERLAASGAVTLTKRAFTESDADGAWLIYAATDEPRAQAEVARAGEARRTFVVAIDDPPNASAYSAGVLRRGAMTIAISTSGEAPALARLMREVLEQALPEEDWIAAAQAMRDRWKAEGTPMASRFAELVRAFRQRAEG